MSALTVVVGTTGRLTLNAAYAACRACVLIVDTAQWSLIQPLRGKGLRVRSTLLHFVQYGVDSLPIVGLISFLIGAIMAMQTAYQLARFGATQYVANLVSVAAIRELAPLMTAILLTGRSGSAITAEIGTMKVAEEIDALEVMGLNSVKYLVVPKYIAMVVMMPCLTLLSDMAGIVGGAVFGAGQLDQAFSMYATATSEALVMKDISTGLIKSVVFGAVITTVGCYEGFAVRGGAEGVGKATTSSVVVSIFSVIVADLFFTALFYYTG